MILFLFVPEIISHADRRLEIDRFMGKRNTISQFEYNIPVFRNKTTKADFPWKDEIHIDKPEAGARANAKDERLLPQFANFHEQAG